MFCSARGALGALCLLGDGGGIVGGLPMYTLMCT